jgi:hypothetical protein
VFFSRNPWSCDGNAHELEEWLKKRYIQHDPVCIQESKDNDKFQRIVSAVDFQNNTKTMSDDELLRLWSLTEEDKNSHVEGNGCGKINSSISNSGSIFHIFDNIPSFWSLAIGLELGIVIGGTGMWLLNRFNRIQTPQRPMSNYRRHSLQTLHNRVQFFRLRNGGEDNTTLWTELDTINCPDTPPPAYRDCTDRFIR